jgi:integrase
VFSKLRKRDGRRVYYIQYWYQGRRLTEKVGLKEDRARGRIEARREALEDPAYIPPPVKRAAAKKSRGRTSFQDFADLFYKEHASKRASAKRMEQRLEHFKRTFGRARLDAIDQYRIEKYLTQRRKKVAPPTVNSDLRLLKNLFNRAVEWGFLSASPAAKIRQLREDPARERYLSQEETGRLIACAPDHLRPIIQTALLTGMRRSEILGLTWDRVNLERRMIYLHRTKSGKPRWVAIGDDLHELLEALPRHAKHDRVFTYRGKPMDSLKRSWEAAREAAGIPGVRFHDLRHTWASRMVAAGVDLYELMDQGGWTTIAMVRRYAQFAPDRRIQTARLVDGTVGSLTVKDRRARYNARRKVA